MRQNWQHLAGSMFSLKYMYKEIHIYNRPLNNMGFNCQVHLYVFLFVFFFSINSATVLQNLLLVESDLEPINTGPTIKLYSDFWQREGLLPQLLAVQGSVVCINTHTHTHKYITNLLTQHDPSTILWGKTMPQGEDLCSCPVATVPASGQPA